MEGAVVSRFIAQIEGQLLFVEQNAGGLIETPRLEILSAVTQPERFGEIVDKGDFSVGLRAVFGNEIGDRHVVLVQVFEGEQLEVAVLAGEAVDDVIAGRDELALFGFGPVDLRAFSRLAARRAAESSGLG